MGPSFSHHGMKPPEPVQQRHHPFEDVVFHQGAVQFFVGLGRTKQHAIGHDHRRPAAGFEQLQEQGHEQQFGFLGFHQPLQLAAGALLIQRSGEGGLARIRV